MQLHEKEKHFFFPKLIEKLSSKVRNSWQNFQAKTEQRQKKIIIQTADEIKEKIKNINNLSRHLNSNSFLSKKILETIFNNYCNDNNLELEKTTLYINLKIDGEYLPLGIITDPPKKARLGYTIKLKNNVKEGYLDVICPKKYSRYFQNIPSLFDEDDVIRTFIQQIVFICIVSTLIYNTFSYNKFIIKTEPP